MATPLIFQFAGEESACHLSKVERSKLYGYVEKEVVDENGNPCSLVTLASDGRTLIGSGGTTFAYFDPDGHWCDKKALQAVDLENEPVNPVGSSFKAPIALTEEVTVEDYLSHNVRAVYTLEAPEGFSKKLVKALEKGTIFHFPFSYRGGLDPDEGFLFQGQDGALWLALGKPTSIAMVGLSESGSAIPSEDEGSDDGEVDLMDFGLM